MPRDDHVAAILSDRHVAEAVIADLEAAGLGSERLGGLTLSLALIPSLAVGGILGVSLVGAAWGAIFGGLIGADVGNVEWNRHEDFAFENLGEDEILVIVKAHEREQLCRQIFTRHGVGS
ncbi:MAG: hypothetical protein O3C62_10995 [Actinomycetota bacterium]|nr:hypothetical protein [Actinomycetota bacterium]MDA2972712.1 hypothetical protein [Actinomycetota bacterium]MDA3002192.1 hypothetical protein [Actinomycetota bacterium]